MSLNLGIIGCSLFVPSDIHLLGDCSCYHMLSRALNTTDRSEISLPVRRSFQKRFASISNLTLGGIPTTMQVYALHSFECLSQLENISL
jgi:hypothetical protein